MTAYHSLADVYEFLTPEALLDARGQRRRVRALAPRRAAASWTARAGSGCWRPGSPSAGSTSTPATRAQRWSRRTRARGVRGGRVPVGGPAGDGRLRHRLLRRQLAPARARPLRRAARHGGRAAAGRDARADLAQLGARAAVGVATRSSAAAAARASTYTWSGQRRRHRRPVDGDQTVAERLTFCPFTLRRAARRDLRAVGLEPSRARSRPTSIAISSPPVVKRSVRV